MATQDIPEGVAVLVQNVLTIRNAPPEIVPEGAIAGPEQAVGKFTATKIFKDQIVLAPQLSAVKVVGKLAASVPEGQVAMAWPASDLMGASQALYLLIMWIYCCRSNCRCREPISRLRTRARRST